MKVINLILISFVCLLSNVALYGQDINQEPDFLYEGILIQGNDENSVAATEAHFETYADWGHDQRYAVRIKENGKTGQATIQSNTPSKLILRTGFNSIAPANVFSLVPFKQKKKQRNIDFIGFYREKKVNSTTNSSGSVNINESNLFGTTNVTGTASATTNQRISYTNLPDYEDRFPKGVAKINGKKLGDESYILNIPALEPGEYALCFKDNDGVLMLVDFSVK